MSSPSVTSVVLLGVAVLGGVARPAAAERDIVIESPGERSLNNKLLLVGLAGAGVLAGGLGLYWHLDSRSASRDVAAKEFVGEAWSSEDIALVDRAARSRTRATVAYGVGGALLVGAVVALIVTEPRSETIVIHPRRAQPTIMPTDGGAVLGGRVSF